MLPPMRTGSGPFFSRKAFSLPASASRPSLLKPMRLIRALSAGSRNRRGCGLPSCATGVTVPTSMNPKPRQARPSMCFPSLSKPAARPTGLGKSRPIRCFFKPGRSTQKSRRSSRRTGGIAAAVSSRKTVMRWAFSGEKRNRSGLKNAYTGRECIVAKSAQKYLRSG